jgi:RES domain-containing protein
LILWRISNHASLKGRGGLFGGARWHSEGRRIVYLAESPAGALIEALAHLEVELLIPMTYQMLKVELPRETPPSVAVESLPANWINGEKATREIGDAWLAACEHLTLRVPSAIVPETFNLLFNPAHPRVREARILWHRAYPWDRRLL